MALWEEKRKNGKPIGCLHKKHMEAPKRMEVCTKPSAEAAGRTRKSTLLTSF